MQNRRREFREERRLRIGGQFARGLRQQAGAQAGYIQVDTKSKQLSDGSDFQAFCKIIWREASICSTRSVWATPIWSPC
ncbi:hypothetical protein [Paraburkholderia phytofirmans]|uniref:Uncharacterized protein n=1 Tax=Paraburkholderia phytofirmans OLGA172 TaxID=1417228 RepID=A0A160FU68_9BURK|nr:hypothetical protein [Paraburkholderia phytofirmans]ANB76785.1 hypothetical protein AYM40_31995 [Paraburkholderia phytofirmans OLGA172]